MIKRLASRELKTKFGTFTEILYYDGQKESIALAMGDISGESVLCRMHSHCIGAHVFNSIECTCREEMEAAQKRIQMEGRGVIIWLDQEGKGNGHLALIESIPFKKEFGQAAAYVKAGYKQDARDYSAATQILSDLNIRSIVLLSNSASKAEVLATHGISVTSVRALPIADKSSAE
ncbi:MAG: GTP cyclohydrolase [Acidobacteria bacterium]|nr:MAG: GTP cyclohydrolase [Acidobacteriota bacterium]